jgi:hypothetical protein
MTCPRCKREVDPWPLARADVCSPKGWLHCIRDFGNVLRQLDKLRQRKDNS